MITLITTLTLVLSPPPQPPLLPGQQPDDGRTPCVMIVPGHWLCPDGFTSPAAP